MSNTTTDIQVDFSGILGFLGNMRQILNQPEIRQAMLDSSHIVEGAAKRNLQKMVYDMPERWYRRKHSAGLFGATQPFGKSWFEKGNTILVSGVRSTKHYAVYVHFGTGIYAEGGKGRKTPWMYKGEDGKFHRTVGVHPKPYLSKGLIESKMKVESIVSSAIEAVGRRTGGK